MDVFRVEIGDPLVVDVLEESYREGVPIVVRFPDDCCCGVRVMVLDKDEEYALVSRVAPARNCGTGETCGERLRAVVGVRTQKFFSVCQAERGVA